MGKQPIRSKLVLENQLTEQVYKFWGCCISSLGEVHINHKTKRSKYVWPYKKEP
jgi:hypothetical protein